MREGKKKKKKKKKTGTSWPGRGSVWGQKILTFQNFERQNFLKNVFYFFYFFINGTFFFLLFLLLKICNLISKKNLISSHQISNLINYDLIKYLISFKKITYLI
jgi:hypothetical protein